MKTPQELVVSLDGLVNQLKTNQLEGDLDTIILAVTSEIFSEKAKDMVRQRFKDLSMTELCIIMREVSGRQALKEKKQEFRGNKKVN